MWRFVGALSVSGLIACAGCGEKPKPIPRAATSDPAETTITDETPDNESADVTVAGDPAPGQTETSESEPQLAVAEPPADDPPPANSHSTEPVELKLEGISFDIPGGWKAVKPPNRIIEAEFELQRVEGDEYDGRLTLMSSGGDPEEAIANRSAEFIREPGDAPLVDKIMVGDIEATWVDLRGEWKGPSFRPIDPRPEYRMLLVIVPFTSRSAFYAKLTGPRETIAAHEQEFRRFIQSAQITR